MARTFDPVGAFQRGRSGALQIQAQEQQLAAQPARNQLADLQLEQARVGAQRKETQFGQQQSLQKSKLLNQTLTALSGIPLEQRDAAFSAIAPQLQQFGIDTSTFEPGEFTDEGLAQGILETQALIGQPAQQKQTAGQQEFNALVAIAQDPNATLLERNSANRALGNLAKVSTSAAERIASDPELTKAVATSGAEIAGAEAGAKETSKLFAKLKLEPQVKAAAAAALSDVKVLADQAAKTKANNDVFAIYEVGMSAVADALGDTSTGFFAGRIPSITANQQIADGAIAAIAPVLKQLFRSAGEGIFTDKDQELLLAMIPTRKTSPEAIASILSNVDAIIKAKLGIGQQQPSQQGQQTPAAATFNSTALGRQISEQDIIDTLQANPGLTREQLFQQLGIQQ
jgi:hypothetical protein